MKALSQEIIDKSKITFKNLLCFFTGKELLKAEFWQVFKTFFACAQVAHSVDDDSEGVHVDREAVIFRSRFFLHFKGNEPLSASKALNLEICPTLQVQRDAEVRYHYFERLEAPN